MGSIGISELLVIGAVCALFAVPVAAVVILVVVLTQRGKKARSNGVPQLGGQNETV
jgi:cytochrome c-type biogenesis protein CcmH/NrfF